MTYSQIRSAAAEPESNVTMKVFSPPLFSLYRMLVIILAFFGAAISAHSAYAAQVNLTWDPPDAAIPEGYKVYYGIASGNYTVNVYVDNGTSCSISGLDEGKSYYFAATACYPDGSESGFSNEAVKFIPENDSDGDGIPDSEETALYDTDPDAPDTDGDDIPDGQESFQDSFMDGSGKTEIIIDNTDAGFSSGPAPWPTSSYLPGGYEGAYQYSPPAGGSNWARWTSTVPASGECDVFARWTAGENRATDATYTIINDGSRMPVAVDQTIAGGQFISLGTHWLTEGAVAVTLTDAPTGYVIADAIMIACDTTADSADPPNMAEIIIDNGDEGFSSGPSAWRRSSFVSGYYGSDYQYADDASDGQWATWSFQIPISGLFEIANSGSEMSAMVDQTIGGGQFASLGTYWFETGSVNVTLKSTASGYVVADAIKIIPR